MRDIIFRAKRINDDEWIEGYHVKVERWADHYVGDIIIPRHTIIYPEYPHCEFTGYDWINPKTLGRFIEYYDRHKQPIFEGDIVEFVCGNSSQRYLLWWSNEMCMLEPVLVEGICFNGTDYWNEPMFRTEYSTFCLMLQDHYGDYKDIRVIGNIYDNPELIKVCND